MEESKRKEAADKKLAEFAARRGNQPPSKEEMKMKAPTLIVFVLDHEALGSNEHACERYRVLQD